MGGGIMRLAFLAWLIAAAIAGAAPLRAAETVDMALVLVVDVSLSIDDEEYALEKQGYRAAFTDRRVIEAIRRGAVGAIAVTYVEFARADQVRQVLDWTVIRDEAGARDFAAHVEQAPRSFRGPTAISAGIDLATQLLVESSFDTERRVIDVSGDGTNNSGRVVTFARDEAVAAGITINGLTIINDKPRFYNREHTQPPGGLTKWYQDNVIGGPGAFVLEVHDFASFGEAMTRKLITEIALAKAE
jgi:hypothetical protein